MSKQVILTADDYGVHKRIDDGIIAAIQANKLTSVSVIVTHDGWEERVDRLLQLLADGFQFGIGLHFCITSGKPRAKNPSSPLRHPVNTDFFRTIDNYNFNASHQKEKDVFEELDAQFQEITKKIAVSQLDHLTNHHNIVYADEEFFAAFIKGARKYKVPVRSPMSWYRKFKPFQAVPDYEGGDLLNPTMRRGLKIGMWRKITKLSYGNLLKRMHECEIQSVAYPDVLCEYIYGQCVAGADNKGVRVIEHALYQLMDSGRRKSLNQTADYDIPVDFDGVIYANEHTVKKARKSKRPRMSELIKKYAGKRYTREFSMELIFHLAAPETAENKIDGELHGINLGYIPYREGELDALKKVDLKKLSEEIVLFETIPFKALK